MMETRRECRRRNVWSPGVLAVLPLLVLGVLAPRIADANGLYRNGVGARQMALGGADVAWAQDALEPRG